MIFNSIRLIFEENRLENNDLVSFCFILLMCSCEKVLFFSKLFEILLHFRNFRSCIEIEKMIKGLLCGGNLGLQWTGSMQP